MHTARIYMKDTLTHLQDLLLQPMYSYWLPLIIPIKVGFQFCTWSKNATQRTVLFPVHASTCSYIISQFWLIAMRYTQLADCFFTFNAITQFLLGIQFLNLIKIFSLYRNTFTSEQGSYTALVSFAFTYSYYQEFIIGY